MLVVYSLEVYPSISDVTDIANSNCVQTFICILILWPSVQFSSVAQLCPTLHDPMNCSSPGLHVHHQLPEFTQTRSHLILYRPLLLLPPIPPSIRVFSNESTLRMRWPKYWNFSFSIILSKEIPGLISFRMDWLDLLAVQGTLMSLLQHHSSKASILQRSAFFTVQLSHPYMTTGKTIALTRWTFVGKVMSLLVTLLNCKLKKIVEFVRNKKSHGSYRYMEFIVKIIWLFYYLYIVCCNPLYQFSL